jgi:hypothetical protein
MRYLWLVRSPKRRGIPLRASRYNQAMTHLASARNVRRNLCLALFVAFGFSGCMPCWGQYASADTPMSGHGSAVIAAVLPSPAVAAADTSATEHGASVDSLGSSYIPVDSWVYPAALRLYSRGYLNTLFISMRPWTRRSLLHALQASETSVRQSGDDEAQGIYTKLNDYLLHEGEVDRAGHEAVYGVDTLYTRVMGIENQTLRDSFHLGQTLNNDYGRPYEPGFNAIVGASTSNEIGPFSLYIRGEYQRAPSAAGYSQALSAQLSQIDTIPFSGSNLHQGTIPTGPIAPENNFRLVEATLSAHVFGNEISGGKSDLWSGPGFGGAMGWSNNAENIYSFRINRVEPLAIPFVSRFLGPLRYDFLVGSLKGHTDPNEPWIHTEMFSFHPRDNFQFTFQRSVIWGGKGHEPITLHTFLRSFFSLGDTANDASVKATPQDPGARFSVFSFSWRLPFLRKYVTLYTDSIAHDDVSPISAPRRAAYRPGLYFTQLPHLPHTDFRIEAANTDTSTLRSLNGQFNYWEQIQVQGYTNKGYILGDWVGREAKGGQAWLTQHLSGNEYVQLAFEYKKTPKDFIPGGTTQQKGSVRVVKRLSRNIELDAQMQFERWVAPIYEQGVHHDFVTSGQITWFPGEHGSAPR